MVYFIPFFPPQLLLLCQNKELKIQEAEGSSKKATPKTYVEITVLHWQLLLLHYQQLELTSNDTMKQTREIIPWSEMHH